MENFESLRDLSAKWLENNVFQALEKIEEHGRLMRNGCSTIYEYVQIEPNRIQEIQLKNMKLMIDEIEICLLNTQTIIEKESFDEIGKKLRNVASIFTNGIELKEQKKIIYPSQKIMIDPYKRTTTLKLTSLFYILQDDLIKIHFKLINVLAPILFIKKNQGVYAYER